MRESTRHVAILVVLAAIVTAVEHRREATKRPSSAAVGRRPSAGGRDNVILVVADGMRWQELFRGADSALVHGDAAATRRFWRPTLAERRRTLMPFMWSTVAREGALLGNVDAGSRVSVTNPMWFSYPGYNELLTGRPDPRIDRNDHGPNPNVTVFEWLNRRVDFRGRVAAVGGWDAFSDIFNVRRSAIALHAARETPIDARSHVAALGILRERQPRALFVAYVETDDHAHAGRYDRTLDAVQRVDTYVGALWAAAQADPRTRGRTTLIFTTDHGRGRTSREWTSHNRQVPGSNEVFVAMIGPRTPSLGELRGGAAVAQAQVAATVAAAVGLEFRGVTGRAAPPIRGLLRRASQQH